ncbi:hypothetical protein CL176_09160 [Suicoccus acidiformans]|uniref:Uncharacterized protein n=1 Tax=Suicoccus acidiformans TaxID=2036206 RepID=A0A347WM47_9LACT|nr:hypothetical protein [Suicoccus acidiformans]AXY26154.1 hypothetical protein CL176_09160 [Suicoccus acidiformans]
MNRVEQLGFRESIERFRTHYSKFDWWLALLPLFFLSGEYQVALNVAEQGDKQGLIVFSTTILAFLVWLVMTSLIGFANRIPMKLYRDGHRPNLGEEFRHTPFLRDFGAILLNNFVELLIIISVVILMPMLIVIFGLFGFFIAIILPFVALYLLLPLKLTEVLAAIDQDETIPAGDIVRLAWSVGGQYRMKLLTTELKITLINILSALCFLVPLIWTIPWTHHYRYQVHLAILAENNLDRGYYTN